MAEDKHTIYEGELRLRGLVHAVSAICLLVGVVLVALAWPLDAAPSVIAPIVLALASALYVGSFFARRRISIGLMPLAVVGAGAAAASALADGLAVPGAVLAWPALALGGLAALVIACTFVVMSIACRASRRLDDDATLVVLGCAARGGVPSPTLALRLERALAAWREAPGRRIVVTGGPIPFQGQTEADVMQAWLLAHDVPAEAITVEDDAVNTEENLARSLELLSRAGQMRQIAIVTSDYHMWRARAIARRLGIDAQPLACKTPSREGLVQWCREVLVILSWLTSRGN